MQAPYNDRWERKKRYLLHSFLVNPGFRLSPIPEEERSPSPSDTDSLPDLVVEPEPNRHDDPPEFYEDLARRMRRLHRQLFLGENGSDGDSSDFEVNRSTASTFMLIDTRKDNEANIEADESAGDLEDSANMEVDENGAGLDDSAKNTKSTQESLEDDNENRDKYDDIMDTCATYNDTKHVSTESSSVDEETPKLIDSSINESNANKTDDPVHIEAYGNQSYEDEDESSSVDEETPILIESDSINESHSNKTDDPVHIEAYGNQSYEDEDESSSADEETPILIESDSIIESHSNKTDDPVHIEAYGNQSYEDSHVERLKKSALNETVDASIIETELDTEDSAPCHRISTTVAEIHKRPARDAHEFDNGSPVLIPRLLQFGRRVFGSEVISGSGKSFNSEASDEFITRLSSYKSDLANKDDNTKRETEEADTEVQRLLAASDLTRASLDSDIALDENEQYIEHDDDTEEPETEHPLLTAGDLTKIFINSSESVDGLSPAKSIEDDDSVELMREARVDVNESWHGEAVQDSPELAFEAQTDADKLDNESSVSNGINALFEELEASEDPPSTRNVAKIIDDFWSVSSIDLDEELSEDYRGTKRRADSSSDGDATSTKRMKDIATQTGSEAHRTWEDIRTEFFVGSPVVLRLCGCQDHVCS